ncbi:MAG: RHS repeat-associated core domain-containing protein, partial [Pyrinomonadaceae bacterium]
RLYPPGSSSQVAFEWLVPDQLGTPRIIVDKTGSLATTKRHDYLPFGEELFSGTGGRSTTVGYTADTIRQRFTSYERDTETGLDFAQARYYSNTQGRFASVDPLMASASSGNPQSWNRYAYVGNDPLNATDPSGMMGTREPVDRSFTKTDLGVYGNLFSALSYDESWIEMQEQAQRQQTILIIVGDPGLLRFNVGTNFDRVAQTKKEELEGQGYAVVVQRASGFQDFANALTNNGILDGVEYVGHGSNIMLFVGEQHAPGTNVDHSNIPQLSNANLSKDAYIKLNTCNASAGGSLSIGQWLANRLDRTVFAFDGPSHFYGGTNPNPVRTSPRPGDRPPERVPLRLLEDRGTRLLAIRPG